MKNVERWVESKEREERRKNIMIFGWTCKGRVEKRDIAAFFKEKLGFNGDESSIVDMRVRL